MTPSDHKFPQSSRLTPARVVLLYALIAALWIIASGQLLTFVVENPVLRERIEIAKGLAFVAVTSGLLYLLLKGWRESIYADKTADNLTTVRTDDTRPLKTGRLALLFLAFALVIPLIGLVVTKLYGPQIERDAYANLQAVADLKAGQINHWLDERSGDAMALAVDRDFAGRVDQFMLRQRDASLSKAVLDRLANLRIGYDYNNILLFDRSGKLLLLLGDEADNTPALQQQLRQAMSSRQVQHGDLYRDESGHIHLDWVVPIFGSTAQDARPAGVVVLRVTAQHFIFPLIQTWPTISASAETLLVRRDGESVLFLNTLRHQNGMPLTLRRPISEPESPAAIAIRTNRPGTLLGTDYRGEEVLAAYRPVEKTNWYLIAKIDRNEVLAPLQLLAFLVSLVAAFAIAAVSAVVLMLWRSQRRTHTLELQAHAMAAVKESELQYRTLANSGQALIWTSDTDKLCDYFNKVWLDFTGRTLEQELGNGWAEGVHPDDFQQCLDGYVAAFDRREKFSMEYRLRRHDGEYRWLLDDGCPRYNSGGEFIGYIGYCLDITERKRAEQTLQQSEEDIKTLVEHSPIAMLVDIGVDADEQIVMMNKKFTELFGYTLEEIPDIRHWWPLAYPDEKYRKETKAEWIGRVEKAIQSHDDIEPMETRVTCKDGSSRYVRISLASIGSRNIVTFEDFTGRKLAEESLRKLSLAVEQSPSSIVITDLDAKIEYANAAFVKATGYSLTEAIGQNPRILQSGKTPRANYDELWAHLTRGEVYKGEFFNRRKDGSEYTESVLISPVRQLDGRVTHYLAIKEDITEFKQSQEALRASREHLHRLLNSMAEGAYGVDTNGNCTFVNSAFLQMLGYQHESEVLGKHIHELIHHSRADGSPYPAEECKAYCAYQINQSTNVSDEVFWRKDGAAIPVEYWSHPIVSDGVTTGAIVTFIDITERKLAESKLAEQLDELRHWHNATSGREGRILELKHEINELLGKSGLPPRYPSAEFQDQTEE